MASGTINLSKSKSSGSYIEGKIVWSATADKEANASKDISAKLYVRKGNPNTTLTEPTGGNWKYSLTVNGSKVSGSIHKSVLTDWVLIKTKEISKISHDSDGSKKIEISGYVKAPTGTSYEGHETSGEKTVSFDTIPRATSFESLSCSTSYFTGTLTYKYTPKSSAFYNRCNISLNLDGTFIAVKSIDLGKKSAAQQTETVTLSDSELETIYKKLPSSQKGTLRFTFRTYSDSGYSKQIGDAVYKEVTLYIPNDSTTQPSVTMSLAPVGSLPAAFNGLYVQGKTKVKATLSAEGKFDADIKSYSMKVDGTTYDSGDNYTSGYLTKIGKFTVYGYAKDSREYTGSTSEEINVIGYSKPKILNVEASRCDKNGNIADDGTYLKIIAKRSYSLVQSDGVQHNFCKIQYRYKLASAASYPPEWKTILAGDNLSSDQIETDALLDGVLSIASTYHVQVRAIDDIGEYADTEIIIPTDIVHNHKTKNGWGFGKYCEGENLLDCEWDANFRGDVRIGKDCANLFDIIYPVGSIYISAVNQNPFDLFGFGKWEQIQDCFLLGASSKYPVGVPGGEEEVELTVDEIPSHAHKMIRPKWYASDGNGTVSDAQSENVYGYTSGTTSKYLTKGTGDIDIQPTGGGKAHNNMPPYLPVYIWKRMS